MRNGAMPAAVIDKARRELRRIVLVPRKNPAQTILAQGIEVPRACLALCRGQVRRVGHSQFALGAPQVKYRRDCGQAFEPILRHDAVS
jgi:hypothetical protein